MSVFLTFIRSFIQGYQVAPAQLEGVLLQHPSVADAAVIPSEDEEAGEVPKVQYPCQFVSIVCK